MNGLVQDFRLSQWESVRCKSSQFRHHVDLDVGTDVSLKSAS